MASLQHRDAYTLAFTAHVGNILSVSYRFLYLNASPLQLTTSQRSEIVKAAAKVLDVKDSQLLSKLGSLILKITVRLHACPVHGMMVNAYAITMRRA